MLRPVRRSWRIAFLLVCCAQLVSCARPKRIPPAKWTDTAYDVRTQTLRNGLRVAGDEDDGTALISTVLVVAAGAAADPPGKEGLAHLVEHLVFRARHEQDRTLQETLEFSGAASVNAFTTPDVTVYTYVTHRAALPVVAAATHWILTSPLSGLDEDTFEAERQVVLAELRESAGLRAHGDVYEAVWAAAFPPEHPYARPVGGTEKSLLGLTLEDVRAFASTHYSPERATLVTAGGANQGVLKRHLERSFGTETLVSRPPAPGLSPTPNLPEPPPLRFLRRSAPIDEHELHLVWSLPRGYGPDGAANRAALKVMAASLERISREDDDVRSITVSQVPGGEATLVIATAVLQEGAHPAETAKHLTERFDQVVADFGDVLARDEYRAANRDELAAMVLSSEDPTVRSMERAMRLHFVGSSSMAAVTGELMSVPKEALLSRLRQLSATRSRAVYIHPSGSIRAARSPLATTRAGESKAAPRIAPLTLVVPREELSRFSVPVGVEHAISEQLPNGIEVIALKTHHKNTVSVTLDVPGGGALSEPLGAAQLGEFLTFRADATQTSPLHAGGQPDFSLNADTRVVSVRGQPQNLKSMLMWLERETDGFEVEAATLPAIEFEVYPLIEKYEAMPEVEGSRQFWSSLYAQHPYGRVATVEDLKSLDDGDIEDWMERAHRPGAGIVVIAGDLDPREAVAMAREVFGAWENDVTPVVAPERARAQSTGSVTVVHADMKDARQAAVQFGCLLPQADERQVLIHQVLAAALEGELTRDLREQAGLTYGVAAASSALWGGSAHLQIETNVSAEHLPRVLQTLRERLGRTGSRVDPREVDRARWDVIRTRNLRQLTSGGIARAVAKARRQGFSLASVDRAAQMVSSISAPDLEHALEVCREHWVLLLTGAPEVTRQAVRTSGWDAASPELRAE